MNKVVKAENEKVAALDFANAVERQADGEKRAEIKKAEGIKQAKILAAEGEAQAIQLVNEAANTYFVGNAQLLRKLEALEKALSRNAKIVIPSGSELVNVIGEMAASCRWRTATEDTEPKTEKRGSAAPAQTPPRTATRSVLSDGTGSRSAL